MPIDALRKCRGVTATLDFSDEICLALHVDALDEATAKRVLDMSRSIHILGMESIPGLKNRGEDLARQTIGSNRQTNFVRAVSLV